MEKLKLEQIGLNPTCSMKVGIYPGKDYCGGVGWHVHPEYEVVYIRNGQGTLNIRTKQLSYTDGALLFIGPDIPHMGFGNTDLEDWMEVVVQFDQAFIDQRLAAFPEFKHLTELAARSRYGLVFSAATKARVAVRFEAMREENLTERLLTFLDCLQIMVSAPAPKTLFSSPADLPARLKSVDLKRLERVFQMINNRFDLPLTSADMASEVGMTPNSFCRFFKANTNQTFTRFLNDFRLERAKDMLRGTPESIQAVMYACGFRDAPYFSRKFRLYAGASPQAFRDGYA